MRHILFLLVFAVGVGIGGNVFAYTVENEEDTYCDIAYKRSTDERASKNYFDIGISSEDTGPRRERSGSGGRSVYTEGEIDAPGDFYNDQNKKPPIYMLRPRSELEMGGKKSVSFYPKCEVAQRANFSLQKAFFIDFGKANIASISGSRSGDFSATHNASPKDLDPKNIERTRSTGQGSDNPLSVSGKFNVPKPKSGVYVTEHKLEAWSVPLLHDNSQEQETRVFRKCYWYNPKLFPFFNRRYFQRAANDVSFYMEVLSREEELSKFQNALTGAGGICDKIGEAIKSFDSGDKKGANDVIEDIKDTQLKELSDGFSGRQDIIEGVFRPDEIFSVLVGDDVASTCSFDVDGNRKIDIADLVRIARWFGNTVVPGAKEDINQDGVVDIADLVLVARQFGKSAGQACGGGSVFIPNLFPVAEAPPVFVKSKLTFASVLKSIFWVLGE